jgi:carotenoid cleavage dioxygenase-like enzyme
MATTVDSNTPFYLRGNFAPVTEEVTAFDLPVQGKIPEALRGRYVRNGPNQKSGAPGHWFVGDGMLHGVELRDGAARWYRNRWVRTKALAGEGEYVSADGKVDFTVGVANTHIVEHAGRMLALVESSLPTEVTPELDTAGVYDFAGKLNGSMTAHPKLCPTTGELHFFGYSFFPPYLVYHVADAAGNLVHSEPIDVKGPTMIHDFNVTATRVVFMDLPVVFDLELAMQGGGMPYRWDPSYGARLGVLPRRGSDADTKWYEIDPCYVFHPVNAFDDGDAVVIDVPRYDKLWERSGDEFSSAHLWRWRIDPSAGKVSSEQLDDRSIEFPRADPRRVGLTYRYHYDVNTEVHGDLAFHTLVKYDRDDGSAVAHDFGPGRVPGEAVFVPANDDAAEDDGWLLTYVYDEGRDGSDFVILDARDLTAPPVAVVALPQRVPFGFHGSWIADPI